MQNMSQKFKNATLGDFKHRGLSSEVQGGKKDPQIEKKLDMIASTEYPNYITDIVFSEFNQRERIPIKGDNLEEIMRTVALHKESKIAIQQNQEYTLKMAKASAKCDFYAGKIFPKEHVRQVNHTERIKKILPNLSPRAKDYIISQLTKMDQQFGFYFTDRKSENFIVVEKSFQELSELTGIDAKELETAAIVTNAMVADMSKTVQELYLKPEQQELGAIDFKTIKYLSLQTHIAEIAETIKPWMSELEKTEKGCFFGNDFVSKIATTYLDALIHEQNNNSDYNPLAFDVKHLKEELNKDQSPFADEFIKGYHLNNVIHSLIGIDRAINSDNIPDNAAYIVTNAYDRLQNAILNLQKASRLSAMGIDASTGEERAIYQELQEHINNNYRTKEIENLSNTYNKLQKFHSN